MLYEVELMPVFCTLCHEVFEHSLLPIMHELEPTEACSIQYNLAMNAACSKGCLSFLKYSSHGATTITIVITAVCLCGQGGLIVSLRDTESVSHPW